MTFTIPTRSNGKRPSITLLLSFLILLLAAFPMVAQGQQKSAMERLLELKKARENKQPMGGAAGGTTQGQGAQQGGAQMAGNEVAIKAEGLATFYQNDAARSREEAIEAAQRDAVEQASGVMLSTESEMKNFELVSDEVLSRSQGFIRKYDVLKEGRDGLFYRVTINAMVSRQAFVADVNQSLENLYQRVGRPRVMLVVDESDGNNGGEFSMAAPALKVLEKEIRKILLAKGFTFIDARALTRGSLVEKANKGTNTSRESLLDAARTTKAEIVMLGSGRIGSRRKLQQFHAVEASVGLDVIRTDNGQIMASEVTVAKGLHINEDTAAINAFKKAAADLTPKVMSQVTYQWIKERNQGRRIEMIVKGVSYGDVIALRRALTNTVKGIKKVWQKSFSDGVALLELESRDPPDRLAESLYLADFGDFKLEIQDVTASTLTVSMKKP